MSAMSILKMWAVLHHTQDGREGLGYTLNVGNRYRSVITLQTWLQLIRLSLLSSCLHAHSRASHQSVKFDPLSRVSSLHRHICHPSVANSLKRCKNSPSPAFLLNWHTHNLSSYLDKGASLLPCLRIGGWWRIIALTLKLDQPVLPQCNLMKCYWPR